MQSPKFKIYSSSAGSGKTYTLAKEYIKLALKTTSPYYFNHILAVTFTNKAAGEMKERILKYLHQFASEDLQDRKESEGLLTQILQELQEEGIEIDEEELRARASKTFKHIIHEYANFSVSTIDSFVQKIVSAFTEELDFPFNFEVSLDSDVLLDAAVEQLLQKVNTEHFEQITLAIKSFAMEKADEGKSWNGLAGELSVFGKSLLSDQHQEAIDNIADLEAEDFLQIEGQTKAYCEYLETKIKTISQVALESIDSAGLTIGDFFQSRSGVGAYFLKLQNDVFASPNSYVMKAVEENHWYSKTQKGGIKAAIDGIADELSSYLSNIFSIQETEKSKYILFKEILKQTKKLALLSQLKKEIATIQNETGQIHISEFNRKIFEIVMKEPIPFVYERLGEKYNHILIDEFQDTSTLQWHNFLPLVENALANGHFNLAVGDAKQSIYRFRGGEMELIVHLHKKNLERLLEGNEENDFLAERYASISPYLTPKNLSINYRSTKEVITFNNDLFNKIKALEENLSIAPSLPAVYNEYFAQQLPEKIKEGGHVEIDFMQVKDKRNTNEDGEDKKNYDNKKNEEDKNKKDGEDEIMFDRIMSIIKEVKGSGYNYADIAILCRKNKHGRIIANALKDANIDVVSSDSLNLSASDAVNLVISLIKVVQNPEDDLSKYETIYLFFRVVLQTSPTTKDNQIIKQSVESGDIELFNKLFNYFSIIHKTNKVNLNKKNKIDDSSEINFNFFDLQQMALYEIAEKIINTFFLFEHHKELDFLFRFLDVILEFQTKKSTHLTDFLQFWEAKKETLSISTPKGQEAINVMSIHKSKGLEFPVVIIPYCHWTTDTSLRTEIWADLPIENELIIANESSEKADKILKNAPLRVTKSLEQTAVVNQYKEEKEKTFLESLNMLYVGLTRPTDRLYLIVKKNIKDFNKTVGNQLYQFVNCPPIEEDENHFEIIYQGEAKKQKAKKEKEKDLIEISAITSFERSNKVKLRQSAERLFDLKTFEKSKDYGNKVHAAFAKIKTYHDTDYALQEILREGLITATEVAGLKHTLENIMSLPAIKPLFEVAEEAIKNEREILMPKGKPLRPDRVIRLKDKIVILDYKTGSKSDSHKTQVRQYMNIYREMGHAKVEGILVYLEEKAKDEQVVEVD